MLDKKRSFRGSLIGGIFSTVILVGAVLLLLHQQYVKDQITVWSFKPSQNVQKLETSIGFTPKGTFYFYAQQPEVEGSSAFNKDCQRQEVGNPILGCYLASRIYVYNVTNAQLDGIEQVTAAHETLHAIWERMSDSEHTNIGALLEKDYAKLSANTELMQRMDYYKRTEPGQFDNELHSILGTEVGTLSPDLEAHYKQYFSNRQTTVEFHTKYAAVFTSLKTQSDSLFAELTILGKSIESRSTAYDTDVKQLSVDITVFNKKANNGDFSSISQFNSERATLLKRSQQIDINRASISADIDTYNAKYKQYQQISSEIELLNKSIDSIKDLQPAPSV